MSTQLSAVAAQRVISSSGPGGDLLDWARDRTAALLEDLPRDSPLRALLLDATGAPAVDLPPPRTPTTQLPVALAIERTADGYRVRTRCGTWAMFVDKFGDDLENGGCFVECLEPPALGSRVQLRIELPAGAKDLAVEGEVVHVREPGEAFEASSQPGFGLQLGLSSIRAQKLREVVASARGTADEAAPSPTGDLTASSSCLRLFLPGEDETLVAELQHELRALQAAPDEVRLGVEPGYAPDEVYAAFFRRSQHWRDRASGRSDEVHAMVEAIVDLLQVSCARLRAVSPGVLPSSRGESALPRPASHSEPQPQAAPVSNAIEPPSTPSPEQAQKLPGHAGRIDPPPSGQVSRLMKASLRAAWSRARDLLGDREAMPVTGRDASPTPSEVRASVDEALADARQAIGDKDYERAQGVLREVLSLAHGPQANTVRTWMLFAEAREAAARRQLDRAIECYQAALRIDPHFGLAEKELLITRCVAGGRG